MRSYPHLACFRRVLGVVDLSDVARNAESLRGKPSEEKSSLSRLSGLVLGKRLDKSEQCSDWGTRPLSGRQKRYAALDARATLLLYRKLAPEVPSTRMEALFNTYTFDPRGFEVLATQTLPSHARRRSTGSNTPMPPRAPSSGRKRRWRGGMSRERLARKRMLGVSVIEVSEAPLDVEGLRERWLGKALLPDLTKEGVVRACIHPAYHAPASGVNGPVLRFNRHQNFVEFGDGFALLMNCGGASKEREHASGFLDENGSSAVWYLHGTLSNTDASYGASAAESSLRPPTTPALIRNVITFPSKPPNSRNNGTARSTGTDGRFSNGAGGAVSTGRGGGEGDAVGRFLQRLADTSSTSSILGDLPPEETDLPPSGRRKEKKGQPGGQGSSADVERWAKETPPPHLVLFARAKGRPFVYCGEVDCVAQEYVWSAGSTRLGAVRLTLALRQWREAAAAATADST
ncbi:unnamed protein product, partial [Sphacelaria rigidula]